ncbi:MAG TPA: glycosyltransferase family 4 protein [Pyrinomonadaceae bacterium]|jgi:glycosyltransferase involved in cell wall biosynthesis|nr:glycosyltransferase family 4 protein [Pyrinomonadaceae bacterium]
MKIAVWHNLPSGGGKRALYDHVRGLVQRGHTVESWCPPTADQTYLPLGEFINEHVLPLDWQPRAEKKLAARLTTFRLDPLTRIEALDRHCRRCAEEINAGGFDLLFANSSLYQAVSSIGRYVRLPKVIYLQEPTREFFEAMPEPLWNALPPPEQSYLSPVYLRDYLKDLIKTQTWRAMLREEVRNAKAFDTVLVNSFYSRESILRAYGLEAKVCYLGVDSEKFVDLNLPREDYVVGLGAFVKLKNVEFALRSLAGIPKPRRPRLVWIGNVAYPPYLEELKRLASELEVDFEPHVRIADDKLVEILNRAMLMLYTSRLEPFGFAPLEANACGTPVLAVAEGGVRETIVDGVNGLLVDDDPRTMAAAVTRLSEDREYARRLGQTGRQQVAERWSIAAAVERLEQRLEAAVEAHGQKCSPPDKT